MISHRDVLEPGGFTAALIAFVFLSAVPVPGAAQVNASADPGARGKALTFSSERNDVSPPLSSMPIQRASKSQVREVPDAGMKRAPAPAAAPQQDSVLQNAAPPGGSAMPAPLTNWAGISGTVSQFSPPDTNGDVGPNHVVQIVNDLFQIWDKSGNSLYGPAQGSTIWQGFGGPCELLPGIDPVLLYDSIADRWIISQSTGPFQLSQSPDTYQCIAVSVTPDPLGSWNRYAFLMPSHHFLDYVKIGVWPDGYYMAGDEMSNDLRELFGARPFVFDRAAMLAGLPATFQTTAGPLTNPTPANPDSDPLPMLPSDFDGTRPPPAGAPNHYVQPGGLYSLNIYRFHVDWADPANTTFTRVANLPIAPFGFSVNVAAQKGTSEVLDLHSFGLMHRLAYRNSGDHESWMANHAADSVPGASGIRWYELRDLGGTPTIYQQGTFGPDANTRWMGSAAMDQNGNIAIGYSVSSSNMFPSIRYAGRLATDPLGTLALGEASAFEGIDFQHGIRWGDYSLLTVDPADDCTFWYTTEYSGSSLSTYDWRTRIVSFRFPGCGPVDSPPAMAISFPSNGAQVADFFSIAVSGTAADDGAVAKVEVAIDDGAYQLAEGTTSWRFPVSMSGGRHIINTRATDNLGVTAASAVTVDAVFDLPPTVDITFPKRNQPLHTPFLVQGTAADQDGSVSTVEITFDTTGVWIPCSVGNGSWFCATFFPDQFTKGKHTVRARAMDNLGAFGASQPVDFKIQ
jgi:Bacterial Ig domain